MNPSSVENSVTDEENISRVNHDISLLNDEQNSATTDCLESVAQLNETYRENGTSVPNNIASQNSEVIEEPNSTEEASEATETPLIIQNDDNHKQTVMLDPEVSNATDCVTDDGSFAIEYDFKRIPIQVTGSWKEFDSCTKNNFTRGCKWAPDGSCILTCSNDNILRIFNLPSQIWSKSDWCNIEEMEAVVRMPEGELIYDFCWYPLMNSAYPSSCCLVSASKSSTVHMWDGFTGELRCSYRTYDQMDEIVTPHSLSFNSDGEKLFCGFEKVVRIFDVSRPGRDCETRPLFAKKSGQPGIVSCFAFTPANPSISALGTYLKTIGIYSEPSGNLECILEGQKGGVTQIQFSPDGMLLYSGGRNDSDILCWDLRNMGTVLFSLHRICRTNQRLYFDISRCGKYIISGNQNGVITVWDVEGPVQTLCQNDFPVLEPLQFYLAHGDCVNGISLHPTLPLLASSSGQRKFPDLLEEEEAEMFSPKVKQKDNSLRLWWTGKAEI